SLCSEIRVFFFFSSRRRHTRCLSDWSSDVCSSDLLTAWATTTTPGVPMHDLTVPRIAYLHSWTSTQDEGWWRLALDHLKIPYDRSEERRVGKEWRRQWAARQSRERSTAR